MKGEERELWKIGNRGKEEQKPNSSLAINQV
jgi:hypothetical protein